MFTEDELADTAGAVTFNRGVDYVQYVHGLQLGRDSATASIQARRVYITKLSWAKRTLSGDCSCPHNAEGYFCKHLVAVGLAVLDEAGGTSMSDSAGTAMHRYLDGLDHNALVGLVEELTQLDESVWRVVQSRAAASALEIVDPQALIELVNEALPGGYVDYRRSFDAAREIDQMLTHLEQLLDAGTGERVRLAAERAVTRLRKVLLNADDSAGVLGDACQRAAELHARACREGQPDQLKLARWLAKFRSDSPGWPSVTLQMYAPALGERGIAAYRAALTKLLAKHADPTSWDRHELDQMALELADHDADVDAAVAILSGTDGRIAFTAIVQRLFAAGRDNEAVSWLDRAVAAGRVTEREWPNGNDFWITAPDAIEWYLAAERPADAFAVAHRAFHEDVGVASLRQLLNLADRFSIREAERDWAIQVAEEQAAKRNDGSALVLIALAEDDLVAAWSAAERFGPGRAWQALAKASVNDLPVAAAELYRPELERLLVTPNTKSYPDVAKILRTMRELYARVGEQATIDAFIADLREQYKRRPSLIAELDRMGLH